MYWNKNIETMDRESMEKLQLERLQRTVLRVYQNVQTYRERMQAVGVAPEDIRKLSDLKYLPFTEKDDLRDNYPYGMFSAPMSEIVRIHASSGTTGKPTVVGYTQRDITNWSELVGRCITMCGGTKGDVIQVAYGYGLFTGGLGLHYGAERVGASVIPISGGNTKRQIMLMKDFGSTMLCCTPSYALVIAETMREMGVDPKYINLKAGIFGAEPWTEGIRRQIQDELGISAMDIYGLSEIVGPGVSCECTERKGMHINEDHFIAEIIDEDGNPLPYGEKGEIVFTTITKEGIPLIRYRTHDITYIDGSTCSCGRTLARMHRIMGRSDDMLIIRGVNVFPSQIESVLVSFPEISPVYQIIVGREHNNDTFEVKVELSEGVNIDEIRTIENLRKRVLHDMHSLLGISVKLTFVGKHSIARSEGKAVRIIDNRNLNVD